MSVLIFIAAWLAMAVPANAGPAVHFLRDLPADSNRVDVAADVLPDSAGALIVGWTTLEGGASDGLLIRVDRDGHPVWRKHLGGEALDILFGAQPDGRGGYVCAGFSASGGAGGTDGWVLRVGATGATTWERYFGGAGHDRLASIQRVPSGWLLAGQTSLDGDTDAWVLHLDASGAEIAAWTWGGEGMQRAFGVEPAADGGCVIAGTSLVSGDIDGFVTRLGPDGRATWTHEVRGAGTQVAYHLRPGPDDSFVMTGYGEGEAGRDADVHVLRLAADGSVVFDVRLGDGATDRGVQSVVHGDGSLIVLAYAKPADAPPEQPAWQTFLHGLDAAGTETWRHPLGAPGRESGRWIAGTPDDLWVVGQWSDAARGGVWVARLEARNR